MNEDVKWMKRQFTSTQIAEAAKTIASTRSTLAIQGWSPYGDSGWDIIGTIRKVAEATSWHGTMNSPEVIAETILTHYLGINVYSWEEALWGRAKTGVEASDEVESTLMDLITWLCSDTFAGGSHVPADTEAAKESAHIGAH